MVMPWQVLTEHKEHHIYKEISQRITQHSYNTWSAVTALLYKDPIKEGQTKFKVMRRGERRGEWARLKFPISLLDRKNEIHKALK